ncbi:hypothetical protein LGM42_25545 [Burkholderia sp. AU39826]|uniref:hypothetical protein n=1 Tax=Burkholderia sp. AU39826 TaxID=2879634 RepID=UPI001CF3B836|nr:hypothetical protein [Burkholderia sp. AU39826]MCA7973237.1 hypothetical protein [Burkholderia sp. AU39826]
MNTRWDGPGAPARGAAVRVAPMLGRRVVYHALADDSESTSILLKKYRLDNQAWYDRQKSYTGPIMREQQRSNQNHRVAGARGSADSCAARSHLAATDPLRAFSLRMPPSPSPSGR